MQYTIFIDIHQPLDKVVRCFDDPDQLKLWMPGLQSMEVVEGTMGQPGCVSKMVFLEGRRTIELTETILSKNLPSEFTTRYHASGMVNGVTTRFVPIDSKTTRYLSENTFEFKGLMKWVSFSLKWVFKKQSMKYLKAFKEYVESLD